MVLRATCPHDRSLCIHDLGTRGDANVTLEVGGKGPRTFKGLGRTFNSAEWMDNGEKLKLQQEGDQLTVDCIGFPYGTNTVVRVIRLT